MIEKIIRVLLTAALLGGSVAAQSTIAPLPNPAPPPSATPPPAPAPTATLNAAVKLNATNIVPGTAAPPNPMLRFAKLSPLGDSPDWSKLQAFAKTMTRAELEAALKEIYTDNSTMPAAWRIEGNALLIQTGDPAHPEARIELESISKPPSESTRPWHRVTELQPIKDRPVLSDLHIALDPGHIGGGYGRIEERFLSFQPNEFIQEGDLSLVTAQMLAERLKALGAYVTLVRENSEPVTKARPATLREAALKGLREAGFPDPKEGYDSLTGDAKLLTVQWQSEKLFYRVSEIHARGKKVNTQIKPDLVLCLHYNAEAWGNATSPQFSPQNHAHVLVNGCYSPAELEQADVRFEMFHRLFSRIHEEEIPLADAVADGLLKATGLPPYIYTTPNARRAGANPAVYARNLLANRLYDCPVVYLEPFVMNHEETYRRLLAGHFVGRTLIAGRLQTSAVEDYVRGVVDGLVAYYQKHRKPL
jgi:N-acetylmuramoyl-L-alanine amidase